jgi:hypothetical protein
MTLTIMMKMTMVTTSYLDTPVKDTIWTIRRRAVCIGKVVNLCSGILSVYFPYRHLVTSRTNEPVDVCYIVRTVAIRANGFYSPIWHRECTRGQCNKSSFKNT